MPTVSLPPAPASVTQIPNILFYTRAGSALYGLDHPLSDADYFVVTTVLNQKMSHAVKPDADITVAGVSTLMVYANTGSHQAVEALMSREKVWVSQRARWEAMLNNTYIHGSIVDRKYIRTITALCFGDEKKRRHAVRIRLNLRELQTYGVMNPRLTEAEVLFVKRLASEYEGEELLSKLITLEGV